MVSEASGGGADAVAYHRARTEFQRAQRRAAFGSLFDRIVGRPVGLRSYEDVRKTAGAMVAKDRRLADVCLDRVLGSIERPEDYTSGFLPRLSGDEDRWVRVRLAVDADEGVPPLDLIEVDGAYYVRDGHHRVSVLKRLGVTSFESWVTRLEPAESAQTVAC